MTEEENRLLKEISDKIDDIDKRSSKTFQYLFHDGYDEKQETRAERIDEAIKIVSNFKFLGQLMRYIFWLVGSVAATVGAVLFLWGKSK